MGPLTHTPLAAVRIKRVSAQVLSWGSHMMGKMVEPEVRLLSQALFLVAQWAKAGWATPCWSLGLALPIRLLGQGLSFRSPPSLPKQSATLTWFPAGSLARIQWPSPEVIPTLMPGPPWTGSFRSQARCWCQTISWHSSLVLPEAGHSFEGVLQNVWGFQRAGCHPPSRILPSPREMTCSTDVA